MKPSCPVGTHNNIVTPPTQVALGLWGRAMVATALTPLKTARVTRNETARPEKSKRSAILAGFCHYQNILLSLILSLAFSLPVNAQQATGLTLSLQKENGQTVTTLPANNISQTLQATVTLVGSTSTTDIVVPITIAGSGIDGVLAFSANNFSITVHAEQSSASRNFSFRGAVPSGTGAYGDNIITVTATPPAASGFASASASFRLNSSDDLVTLKFAEQNVMTPPRAVTEETTVLANVHVEILFAGPGIEGQNNTFSHQPILVDYTFSGEVIDVTGTSHTGMVEIPKDITRPVITLTAPIDMSDFATGERRFTITFSNPRLTSKAAAIDIRSGSGVATFTAIAIDNPQVQMRDANVAVNEAAGSATFTI